MIANLFISFSGVVGFITIFLILLGYKSNRITNVYLVIIFLLMSTRLLLIGIYSMENTPTLNMLLSKYNRLFIVIIPNIYLYFDHMIKDYKPFKMMDLVHYIVPLLFIAYYQYDFCYFKFNYVTTNYFVIFFMIYTFIYLVILYRLINKNVWKRKGLIGVVIKQNHLIRNWSLYLYLTLVFIIARLFISFFVEISSESFNFGKSHLWITAVFFLILNFKIITTPQILYGYTFLNAQINDPKKTDEHILAFWIYEPKIVTTNSQDHQLFEKIKQNLSSYMANIDQFSFNTNAYRNSDYSLTHLSNKLDIPKSHLTFLFKYHSKISFSEYKKIIRIQDGLQLIKSGYLATNTYDSLAKEIGFKSYNTFFVSFKDVTGISPQDFYVQNIKNNSLQKKAQRKLSLT